MTKKKMTDDSHVDATIAIDRIAAMLAFLSDYIRAPDDGSATQLHALGLVDAAEAELDRLRDVMDPQK